MEKKSNWESKEGASYPLGATYITEENSFNFALYSKYAECVTLLIYSKEDVISPLLTLALDYHINKSNRIWHCRIKCDDIPDAKYYAYKIDGPEKRSRFEWHAFDKEKVLLDPYAKSVFFPPQFNRQAACLPGVNDGKAPLGILIKENDGFDWQGDEYIHHESNLIIYELHVKGFTFHESSGVADSFRGTYTGIIDKIPYLKELGITAVELMPVQQYDIGSNEYWGYNTLNFFSPHNAYASTSDYTGHLNEFKLMIRELHKAGIEVILDVVYNHTAEGDRNGPTYSYKGIDNSTYYLISENPAAPYFNYSGTGNTLHTRNYTVRRMILDSLHYWRSEMHIDGFRFDLASVFSRNADGSIGFDEPAVIGMISSDPDLATARFIAEPWDAVGMWQLGKKFPGVQWMQWNSSFKDDVRCFVKGNDGLMNQLIARIYGSEDLFPDDIFNAFHPYQSINYVTAHDGFTLYDLVAYNQKHNEANGENNNDGTYENNSWNCGKEGDENLSRDVIELRKKQAKNFCVLLFIANGVPMFVAGDEFLRTQKGNNNPYNQDNTTSWIDWNLLQKNNDFFQFFKIMIRFRKTHPSLSRSRFWREDVAWFGINGTADNGYHSKALAFYISGKKEEDCDIYVMINAYWQPLSFTIQVAGSWRKVIDTSLPYPADFANEENSELATETVLVKDRSVCVFIKL